MTGTSPPAVDEILALDENGLALWLLRELDKTPPIERGQNFIGEQVERWFPGSKAIGVKQQVDHTGIPTRASTRPALAEQRLKDAYATLMSRNLISPDSNAGRTFCEVTPTGRQQLADAPGADLARVGFVANALTIELHPALRAKSIDSKFRQGQFETALRDSSAYLEGAIRQLASLPANRVGVKLAEEAFARAPQGVLTDSTENPGQAAGLQRLFMGFFGAVRNLVAHTNFLYADPKEAFQLLMLVDYLTGKLDEAAHRLNQALP